MQIIEFEKPVIFRSRLNPKLWKNDQLRPEVKEKLLEHAAEFIKSLEIEDLPLMDVVITGSNTNLTYTKHSDLDLHVIVDMDRIYSGTDLVRRFFDSRRRLWNQTYDVSIRGITVEVYVEDDDDTVVGNAYSIIKDQWLRRQPLIKTQYDDRSVQAKSRDLAAMIERVLSKSRDASDLDHILSKLRQYRQSGLAQQGEFSTENLVYKTLRNQGVLDRIFQRRTDLINTKLSLKEKQAISDDFSDVFA